MPLLWLAFLCVLLFSLGASAGAQGWKETSRVPPGSNSPSETQDQYVDAKGQPTGDTRVTTYQYYDDGRIKSTKETRKDKQGRETYILNQWYDEHGTQTGGFRQEFRYNDETNVPYYRQDQKYDPKSKKWEDFPAKQQDIGYQVEDLGFLAGGTFTQVEGLNSSGQIAGYASTWNGVIRAFLWQNGKIYDLGTLGGASAAAYSLNAAGQVVGSADTRLYDFTSRRYIYHAFLWQNGEMRDLGTLGGRYSQAYGINTQGQVVGWSETASYATHAFLWQNGEMRDLGTLPGGTISYAKSISDSGVVVGNSNSSLGRFDAFRWQAGAISNIGAIPYLVQGSSVNGINSAGQIVGSCSFVPDSGNTAFRWDPTFRLLPLGGLGPSTSSFIGINDAGTAVGLSSALWFAGLHAYRYDDTYGALDLNDYLPTTSGWLLTEADAINNQGQIAGYGIYNGQGHAYLLTPLSLSGLSLSAKTVKGGTPITAQVTLSGPAPGGGALITLSSANASYVHLPSSVVIPSGQNRASFTVTTSRTTVTKIVAISTVYGSSAQQVTLTITP
jgi:probable HAF family extracellular repeat protein